MSVQKKFSMNFSNYLAQLPSEKAQALEKLAELLRQQLPTGFAERFDGRMLHFEVPLSSYPQGYHAQAGQPLPFISLAAQKSHLALYHFGLYADEELLNWWTTAYTTASKYKLNMGKSCIRWKKAEHIPWSLVEELAQKMTPCSWISIYESKK